MGSLNIREFPDNLKDRVRKIQDNFKKKTGGRITQDTVILQALEKGLKDIEKQEK